jgi:hypothetical protein
MDVMTGRARIAQPCYRAARPTSFIPGGLCLLVVLLGTTFVAGLIPEGCVVEVELDAVAS